jgi:hypothetical protein
MRLWHKLISAGVVLSLLLPLVALAACLPASGSECHACCRTMARMARAAAPRTVLQTSQPAPCCQRVNSRQAPVADASLPGAPQHLASSPAAVAVARVAAAPAVLEVAATATPPPLSQLQARLCTLRI